MSTFVYECAAVVAVFGIGAILLVIYTNRTMNTLKRAHAQELKELPLDELETRVYTFETDYFRMLGEENEVVREFKRLIETRDLSALHDHWESRFMGGFIDLERKAGHTGKPLIGEDYYPWYAEALKELYERKKAEL